MTPYTGSELERMLSEVESDLTERKESFGGDAPTKAREAVCAFANDLPNHGKPGVLFVGARDDGTPAGLAVTDQLLRDLADMKTDGNILPPPTLTVGGRVLAGAEMAVVTVWPSRIPLRFATKDAFSSGSALVAGLHRSRTSVSSTRRGATGIAPLTFVPFRPRFFPTSIAGASRTSICRRPSRGKSWRRTTGATSSVSRRPRWWRQPTSSLLRCSASWS